MIISLRPLTGNSLLMRLFPKGYGCLKAFISLCILFFFLFSSSTAKSEENPFLNQLLKKADEEKLYDDRYWQILLHYKPKWSHFRSSVDDPRFFLSPEGKENPKAELEATIRALYQSDKKDDAHPKCRFIARYNWLKEKLNMDESTFSGIVCKDFNNTIDNIVQPKSLVLVFPAFYMNNPASMFGHTLLRIDSSYQSKLLSHAVNYAAYIEGAGILYPLKGIFGFYKGYFKVFPYYERIKEYNDIEQRDMWEYHLNLSEEEVRKMFMHLWELKDIYSYYYFIDENCSYNLLFLLEAARPSVHLRDSVGLWVVPVDTLRVVKNRRMVEGTEFRPALATRIRYIASSLNEEARKTALKIVDRELDPDQISDIDHDEKIKILDLAIEIIQYKYYKQKLSKDEYSKLFLSALEARSKLGTSYADSIIPIPKPPEEGHFSSRLSLGVGVRGDDIFQEVRFRPAYHDLTDPDDGYLEGSQIVFADTALRYYTNGRIRLETFDLLDIVSLSPRNNFFKPFSWKIKTGLTQKMGRDKKEHLIYQLDTGFGIAFKNELIGLYYALAEASLNVGGELRDYYALGVGIGVGTIKKIIDIWKINLSAEALFYRLGERFREYKVSAVHTLRINQNNSLNLSLSWKGIFNKERPEVKLNWNYYF